jgi:hypothetical protein
LATAKTQHIKLEEFLTAKITAAMNIPFAAKKFIIDDQKSTIDLREGGFDLNIHFSSISVDTHIKDKLFIFDIDEDVSASIENTYITFSCTVDPKTQVVQFETLKGTFAPNFLSKMKVKFSGILANLSWDIAQSLFAGWIQESFLDDLVSKYKDAVNTEVGKLQTDGVNFGFHGIDFNLKITKNAISLFIDGSLQTAGALVATAMKIESSEPKSAKKLRGYIAQMKNQLDVYLQQEWITRHPQPTRGTHHFLGKKILNINSRANWPSA